MNSFLSRYFDLAGSPESSKRSSDANEESGADDLVQMEAEDDEGTSSASATEPGAVLSLLKDKGVDDLSESERGNCTDDNEDVEQNKENELQTCEKSNSNQPASGKKIENSKCNEEETVNYEGDSSYRISGSPKKLQKQGILTSCSLNVSDTRTSTNTAHSGQTSLREIFGYKRSLKTRELDDQKLVPAREKPQVTVGGPVQPIEVIDIDSGYLSDTEMSTDGDTPAPTTTPSAVARLSPPSSGGNMLLRQGSAVGTKVSRIYVKF